MKLFERAQALRPEDYQAPRFLAQALQGTRYDRREQCRGSPRYPADAREHLELNPSDARAANLLAATYATMGEPDESGRLC